MELPFTHTALFSMKRDVSGKFVNNWDRETTHQVSLSLTQAAWRSLDQAAQQRGTSRSEVIEQFARSLAAEPATRNHGDNAQIARLQNQLRSLQQQNQALEARLANPPDQADPAMERKVVAILESITDAFVAFDRHWHYTYINQAAAQILHKTPEELIGKHVWKDVFPQLVGGVAYKAMHRAIAEQVPVAWEECSEPVHRWLEVKAYPSAEGLAVYFQDVTERKRIEDERRQAEVEREQLLRELETERAQFEAVLRQMPAGVLIAEAASNKLVLANEQAKQIVGYSFEQSHELEDYAPITPFAAFRPNGQLYATHEYPLARSLRTGETVTHEEMELRYEDGKRTVLAVSSAPILDRQGQILAAAVVLQDITERQHTERLLRQQTGDLENQQKWLEAVLNLMPTPTVFVEPETAKVIFANHIADELAGGDFPKNKSLEEYADAYYCTNAQGDGVASPKENRIATEQMPAVLVARGEPLQNYEMNWHTPGGVRATLCWGETLPAMYGHPAIGIVMFQDVTRLKQTEANLRQAEERLQLALSSAQMVAWDVDLATDQVVCSPNAEEIWGMQVGTADEFRALIHPDDRPLLRQATEQAIAGNQTFAQEYRVMATDGEVRWLKGQGQIYLNASGQPVRMAGVSINITDRKQIEANREALLAELQRKERQQQFLIELNDAARTLQDSEEIIWQVVSATGQHFNVTRCAYGEIDAAQEHVTVDRDYCDGVISVVGQHHMDSFGADIIAELKQGKTIVVDDVSRDPRTRAGREAFAAIETQSLICVPLVKGGRFVALLVLHHATPRAWTADDVALMEWIAEKTWLAVERSRAEADLRESEARLQIALNIGRMGTWEWDMQTDIIRWSEGHFTILGFQPYECEPSYEMWASRVHPDDLPVVAAKLQQAIQDRTDYYHEYRLRWPDGAIRWVETRGQFFYDAQGHPRQSIGAVIDITERKQAEEALHQALQKLNFHVENTPMAVVEWDRDFRVIRWSAGAERILGWQAEEILGKTLTEIPFVYEDDLEPVADVCRRLVRGEEPHILSHNRNYTKDRAVVHCEWYNSTLKDESGQMTSVLSLVLDVTERKLAEQEREQLLGRERAARAQAEAAQQQLATIVDASPVGLALLDGEQRFIAINDAMAEINGLPRDHHLGRSAAELFSQSDPTIVDVIRQIYATGQPFISPNLPLNTPGHDDRRPGYYDVYYLPTVDSNQQIERLLAYVIDVTERVKLERAQQYLAESSAVLASSLDYQTTLEQVAQLTVPKLADWCTVHIVEENGAVEQIAVAHVDPAKLAWAHQIRDKYPLDQQAERGAALTLRTGQSDLVPEIPDELLVYAAKDSEHLEILRQVGFSSVMTVPLRSQDRIIGVISFISAESGRRYTAADLHLAEELAHRASLAIENAQLYQAAQRDRTKAEAANRIKDEFLAVLSHELRSPLNPILGWARLLRSRQLDAAKTDQALETIERNAKLQAQLIEDLLDVSRILQGKLTLNVTPVNLVTTIEAAAETVRLAAEAKRIHIQTTLHAIAGQVVGDTNRLQQVIWNLLSNAVKFTPAGGQVTLTLEQVNAYAQIQVKDTGKGIHPDFLPHVFDYFRQEDGTTTRQFGGLGLGLAIVRQLTELHGGLVWVDSPGQNQGATFTVLLPLRLDGPDQPSAAEPDKDATDLTGLRVLVVDDEADMRELASFILTQAGAQVATAASAIQALNQFNQSVPDLLLCDIGMPELNGYALIQQIRQRRHDQGGHIPAIALTAYAGDINQQQALAAGFQLHLAKPIEPDLLVGAIASLVKPPPPEC